MIRTSAAVDAEIRAGAGRQTIAPPPAGPLSAEVMVDDADRIGVVVERIRLSGEGGSIEARAEALAARLRPGGQPLHPIEVDARLGGATLRSPLDPQRRFYEAEITPQQVELTRKQVDPEGTRSTIPFSLTRDQLAELIDQVEDALDTP